MSYNTHCQKGGEQIMAHLNEKSKKKKEIILKLIAKEITQKEAAYELSISDRQVRRLLKNYKEKGDDAFMHKNFGKISKKRLKKI